MSDRTWQSLDHLAGDTLVKGEFDGIKEALTDSKVSRRGFMTIMSASMALTAAACRRPIQHLVPSTKSHQTAIPGMPIDYTSVYTQRNVAYGALVTSREGRPVRVKGNDKHGVNIGRASVEMQASLLSLYDPERLRRPRVRRGGGSTSYDNAVGKIAAAITDAQAAGKKAVAVINEHASPSYAQLLADMSAAIPAFSTVMMPAIIADGAAAANRAMLGVDAEIAPDLSKAKVVVCVDADPLGADKLSLYHTTRFSQMRSPSSGAPSMSTLIVAEAQYSLTGANSDVRHRLHPSQVEPYLAVLEAEIAGSGLGSDVMEQASAETQKNAKAAAAALKTAQGSAVVMTGRHLSARANGMAIAINNALGAIGAGKIIDPTHVIPNSGVRGEAIAQLVADLEADRVHALIFVDTNPEYTADRAFRSAMIKAPVRAAVNLYADETALVCDIDIPGSHWLESWGDAVAIDGTMSVQQPLIAPLNDGIGSTQDTLMNIGRKVDAALFADTASYYDYVVARWSSIGDWRTVLLDGAVAPTATETNSSASVNTSAGMALKGAKVESGMTVMTVPSLTLYDGYYGNNAWLLELSDPVTKVTWENLAMMSPATAEKMGLVGSREPKALARANGKIVSVSTSTGTLDLPLWIQPGMADDTIAVSLGFGHQAGGEVAMGKGESGYVLAGAMQTIGYQKAKNVAPSDKPQVRIASTQDHHTLDDGNGERPVVKELTIGDVAQNEYSTLGEHFPDAGKDGKYLQPLSIVQDYEYKGHRWGMVIDLSSCTGCSSCIIACQNENNIPVVGKKQVLTGREMAWIRLDRYYRGSMEDPTTIVEPMLCQHCENAPCENVCPVAATSHSPEGLNEMTYNRCVGTRYCLNNCPYKVRRFNFLAYNNDYSAPMELVFNPDVTVRSRGVMEKCTFCVQRLHHAKWQAHDAGRDRVMDGEVVTACQEACPAGAILFGDTNDPNSAVSKARQNERGFRVLSDLNVRPQVTYLAKVRNVEGSSAPHAGAEHH